MERKRKPRVNSAEAFFAREQESWDELTAVWRDLPESAFSQPGVNGDWSLKDVINHIAAWQELATKAINDLHAGEPARVGMSTDRFNAEQIAADRDRPLAVSLARLEKARTALLELLRAETEADLLDPESRQKAGWWAKWNTYAHYEGHLTDLHAFRERLTGG